MKIVTDLSITAAPSRPRQPWYPGRLFASGGVGAVFDAGAPGALWQDTAGTVPAVVGQPVARIDDLSGNGLHATQATVAARPLLARHPATGARNLHPFSQSDTGFAAVGTTPPVVTNGALHLGETSVAITFTAAMAAGFANTRAERNVSAAIKNGVTYASSFHLSLSRALTGTERIQVYFTGSTGMGAVILDAANSAALVGAFQRMSGPPMAAVANGVVTLRPFLLNAVSSDVTLYVNRVQLELGSVTTPYQATQSLADISEAGVPSVHGLSFDGVDDFLTTAAIDLSTSPRLSYAAGVRKISDAARGIVLNQGAAAAQSFSLRAPEAASATFSASSGGTTDLVTTTATGFPAPRSAVLVATTDRSLPTLGLRVNGAAPVTTTAGSTGPGFKNTPLWIGQFGTTPGVGFGSFFSGLLFGMIVINRVLSAGEIVVLEAWLAARTGVTL